MSNMIDEFTDLRGVTQDRAEKATEWLVWSAHELGVRRARRDYAEKLLKVTEKQMFLQSDKKTVAEKDADASASTPYREKLEEWYHAAAEYETMKATADAAAILIDTWRSINSSQRGAKV